MNAEVDKVLTPSLEDRKRREAEFHDVLRAVYEQDPEKYDYYTSNLKFYSVARASIAYAERWLEKHCAGKTVLDFGCGDGRYTFQVARWAERVVGIDISPESVRLCRRRAAELRLTDRVSFELMDGEQLSFVSSNFDVVFEMGVLHHVDLLAAYGEIARVLRPDGELLCAEALGHNPLIQAYRRRTPHLRTSWETNHILRRREIVAARSMFHSFDIEFFHLVSLAAVPFRSTAIFEPLLRFLETADAMLLRVPGLRWWAWMSVFVLGGPRKEAIR